MVAVKWMSGVRDTDAYHTFSSFPFRTHFTLTTPGALPHHGTNTTAVLLRLFQGCHSIRRINLRGCVRLTDHAVHSMGANCHMLCHVNLSGCTSVSDSALLSLSNTCSHLESLDISRDSIPYKITDVGLLALGERCHHLERIVLTGCTNITDNGLAWLAEGCANLIHVDLGGLHRITDIGIRVRCDEFACVWEY